MIFDFGGQWDLITELSQDWGNRLLESKNKTVCTRSQVKGVVSPHEMEPDLPVSIQESPVEVWLDSSLLRGQEH